MTKKTVQDFLTKDLLEVYEDNNKTNETVELMSFMRDNAVPINPNQLKAYFLLKENGLDDIANFSYNARRVVTPFKWFKTILNSLTMADRIRGNAKLSHLLKANANPANSGLKAEDLQAQKMTKSEIGGYK